MRASTGPVVQSVQSVLWHKKHSVLTFDHRTEFILQRLLAMEPNGLKKSGVDVHQPLSIIMIWSLSNLNRAYIQSRLYPLDNIQ